MAKPKSDDKRTALLSAATRIIAAQGLSAPTAAIAKGAGVSSGALFTYFDTKADLLNHLYLTLKQEMATAALQGHSNETDTQAQLLYVWSNWMHWAVTYPEKRRALEQLNVSDDITPESRTAGHQAMSGLAALMEQARANGPMRTHSFEFVAALMNSIADTTMEFMVRDPDNANEHCKAGFDALWHMLN